ncbi:hypothetical protein [Micromonospora vulcania]|uniref:Uncharacterized protein n=1 Tax=Micromonospora vulcania TaxID=1441873 RepID=A0ABW1H1Y4_9ACTN
MSQVRTGSESRVHPDWWWTVFGLTLALVGHGFALGAAYFPYVWQDAGTVDLEAGGRFAVFLMIIFMFGFAQTFLVICGWLFAMGLGVRRFSWALGAGWAGGLVLILAAAVIRVTVHGKLLG